MPSEGRKLGLTVGIEFLVLEGLLYSWRHKQTAATVAGGLGALLVPAALAAPTHLGPLQRASMGLAHLISRTTTHVFMSVVFFHVVTPIGLLMRLFGRRMLVNRGPDGGFWVAPASRGRSDIERRF